MDRVEKDLCQKEISKTAGICEVAGIRENGKRPFASLNPKGLQGKRVITGVCALTLSVSIMGIS